MKKENGDVYITIIDGQHRIRGIEIAIERLHSHIKHISQVLRGANDNNELQSRLKYYQERLNDLLEIQLVVTFFIDKSLEYQAMIFSNKPNPKKSFSKFSL